MTTRDDMTTPHTEDTVMWPDGSIGPKMERTVLDAPIVLNMEPNVEEQRVRQLSELIRQKEREINGPKLKEATVEELRSELARRGPTIQDRLKIQHPLPEMTDIERQQMTDVLFHTSDVGVWAEHFCRLLDERVIEHQGPDCMETINEGTMIGWFANIVMVDRQLQAEARIREAGARFEAEVIMDRLDDRAESVVPPVSEWTPEQLAKITQVARSEARKLIDDAMGLEL